MEVDVFYQASHELGEGILWLGTGLGLAWVDIEQSSLYHCVTGAGDVRRWVLDARPTAIAAWTEEKLLVATEAGLQSFDISTGKTERLVTLLEPGCGLRMNDGGVDDQGRFWVGSMSEAEGEASGKLYCLYPDGRLAVMRTDIAIANGIVFADGGKIMYYADSGAGEIYRCELDPETGDILHHDVFIPRDFCLGVPDGAAIDSDGYLWSCRWDGWGIARFSPDGRLDDFIDLPVARPTRCTFGGDDLATLYITTARVGLDDHALAAQPLAGSILSLRAPVKGMLPVRFSASPGTTFCVDGVSV